MSRKPMEKASGSGRLFIAKNRAGRDGILFPVYLDTATSTLKILEDSDEMTLSEVVETDGNAMKNLLREKWKEVNG